MIQYGRDVVDVAGVAKLAGIPLSTWRRTRHPAFVEAVPALDCSKKPLLYDAEQAAAYVEGKAVPELEAEPAPHPGDLLTDAEAAEVVGIPANRVRDEAADGRMDAGTVRAGRRFWTRAAAEERREKPPARRGRITGSKNKEPRERPADERAAEVAAELAAAERGERGPVTPAELAARYQVSERTAERAIARAQELTR